MDKITRKFRQSSAISMKEHRASIIMDAVLKMKISIKKIFITSVLSMGISTFQTIPVHANNPVAELLGARIGSAGMLSPTTAKLYYDSNGGATGAPDPWATSRPAEIIELAKALGSLHLTDDKYVDSVYAYVHDNIDFVPLYGLQKGAIGALFDQSGTAFDQVHLMVQLLRVKGITANYKIGTITLDGVKFNDWIGLSDAKVACEFLGDAGFPAKVNGSTSCAVGVITSVEIGHIWVEAVIGGVTYAFDPAYKKYRTIIGIGDLGPIMKYDAAKFKSDARSGATSITSSTGTTTIKFKPSGEYDGVGGGWGNRISGARDAIAANLTRYSKNISTYIQTNASDQDIDGIVGGRRIVALSTGAQSIRNTRLPYSATTSWYSYVGQNQMVPNVFRTMVRLNFIGKGFDQTFYLDQIYGRRFYYDCQIFTTTCNLFLGATSLSSLTTLGGTDLEITLNHPYAANKDGGTANGSYMDRTFLEPLGGSYSLILGGGRVRDGAIRNLQTWSDGNTRELFNVLRNSWNDVKPQKTWLDREQYIMEGFEWMQAVSQATHLQAQLSNTLIVTHHMVGIVNGITTNVGMNAEIGISVRSKVDDDVKRKATLLAVPSLAASLEGAVGAKYGQSKMRTTSSSFTAQVKDGYLFEESNGSLFTSGNSTWSPNSRDLLNQYVASGYRIIYIQDSPFYNEAVGSAIAIHPQNKIIAHIIPSSAAKGAIKDNSFEKQVSLYEAPGEPKSDQDNDATSILAQNMVNPTTGSLTLSAADITTGTGGFPYSLAFTRNYDSSGRYQASVLGQGWSHNLDIRVSESSDLMAALGHESLMGSDATLAGMYVALDMLANNPTMDQVILAELAHYFIRTNMYKNKVVVKHMAGTDIFYRHHKRMHIWSTRDIQCLSFGPPLYCGTIWGNEGAEGIGYLTAKTGDGSLSGFWDDLAGSSYVYTDRNGVKYQYWYVYRGIAEMNYDIVTVHPTQTGSTVNRSYGAIRKIIFPFGITVDFTYSDGSNGAIGALTRVSNNLGRSLDFTWNITAPELSITTDTSRTITLTGASASGGDFGNGLLTSRTATDGTVVSYGYGPDNELTTVTLPGDLNPIITVAYDALGGVEKITNAAGSATDYYTSAHQYLNRAANGALFARIFDLKGQNITNIDPLGNRSSITYDGQGRITRSTNPELDYIEREYDARGNETLVRSVGKTGPGPYDLVTTTSYPVICNSTNRPTCNKATSTDGPRTDVTDITTYQWSTTTGRITKVIQPATTAGIGETSFLYDVYGRPTQKVVKIDAVTNQVIQYNYKTTGAHDLDTIAIDPTGNNIISTFTWTPQGQIASINGPLPVDLSGNDDISSYQYDLRGRVSRITNGFGQYSLFSYNAKGQLTAAEKYSAAAALLQKVTNTYTATGKVDQSFGPACNDNDVTTPCDVSTISYDTMDRPYLVTDAEGRKTRTAYDLLGRAETVYKAWRSGFTAGSADVFTCDPILNSVQQCYSRHSYSPNGKELSIIDANHNRTEYSYDGYDRLVRLDLPSKTKGTATSPNGPDYSDYEAYIYDTVGGISQIGQMLQKRTRSGKLIDMRYDVLGRVASKAPQGQPTITTAYDLRGLQTSVSQTAYLPTLQTAHIITRGYNILGQLTVTTDNGRTLGYQYDVAGNRTRITWPDGYHANYAYDVLGRILNITENGAGLLATYAYDTSGRRASVTLGNGAITSYTYEVDDALNSLSHNMNGSANDVNWTYDYNTVGQLTRKVIAQTNSLYEWLPVNNRNDAYVANGLNQYASVAGTALVYDGNGNLTSDGVWSYGFDSENRLLSAAKSGTIASYRYDPVGRRSAKVVNGLTTEFLNDGVEEIADYDGVGTLLRRYVHGPGVDEYLVMYTGTGTTSKSYFHANHQGSIVAMSDSAGNVTEQHSYDSYGNSDELTGNPFRYTGRRLDAETGLYYYRARYYSPAIGRFLQTDPIGYGDGLNMYAYVQNNPVNLIDSNGREATIYRNGNDIRITMAFRVKQNGTLFNNFSLFKKRAESGFPSKVGKFNVSLEIREVGGFEAAINNIFGNGSNTFTNVDDAVFDNATKSTIVGATGGVSAITGKSGLNVPDDFRGESPGVQKIVAPHEIGHTLGLNKGGIDEFGHVNIPGNLMNPVIDPTNVNPDPTLTEEQLNTILNHPANTIINERK